ncbi:MAG: thiamine phosphate synthase [Candidatus Porifericomitaceae bacterium WSBS_2022_MAG_OTU9]
MAADRATATKFPQRGLYAIIDATGKRQHTWLHLCQAILQGGADAIQYRNKDNDMEMVRGGAVAIMELCRHQKVPCIINDHLHLAAELKADGVHLGQEDVSLQEARQLLGKRAIIGVSCYNSIDLANAAVSADYVAFGSIYPSQTKPTAPIAGLDLLHQAKHSITKPVVAIGGITIANAAATLQAGADLLAVISDLELAMNPQQQTALYKSILAIPHP